MEYAFALIAVVSLGVIVWTGSGLYYARCRCWARSDKIRPGRQPR